MITVKRAIFAAKASVALRGDLAVFRNLQQSSRLDPDALSQLQAERAIAHARFAMEHTTFYRDRYRDAGFTVSDLRDPAAFDELPIVEKSDVRENPDGFRSTEATNSNSKTSATGGSTGQPLHILRDLRAPTRTLEWRLFDWWGVHQSDNIAIVQRYLRTSGETRKHRALWWPSRRFQLDAYRMDSEHLEEFFRRWQRIRPNILTGYVGGIVELAEAAQRRGFEPAPPTAVAVTAAPITPAQRSIICETFKAPVYDHYRSSEVPWLAGECREHNGLHTFDDLRKIEVLGPDDRPVGPGIVGEVVATDLTNRVFPLLRYRFGDRTSRLSGSCKCGVTLSRISPVIGRVTDAIRLANGQVVAGEALAQTFSKVPHAVRKFQIHQNSDYSILVRCVPAELKGAREAIDTVVATLQDVVGSATPVRLDLVNDIAHDGGKIRYITTDIR